MTVRVAPTEDLGLIRSVITDPAVWPHVSDDGSGEPGDYRPPVGPGIVFLVPETPEPCALWIYHRHNAITWEVHTCVLPGWRGAFALAAARATLRWMVGHAGCAKVVTHVPVPNRLAYRFALRVGLVDEGINRQSFLKDGAVSDQHVLGITRGEICQLPPP